MFGPFRAVCVNFLVVTFSEFICGCQYRDFVVMPNVMADFASLELCGSGKKGNTCFTHGVPYRSLLHGKLLKSIEDVSIGRLSFVGYIRPGTVHVI